MNETYQELKERHQKEMNSFPMKFAFSPQQLDEAMRELGTSEVMKVGAGGLIRKTDKENLLNLFKRHDEELNEAMKNEAFAEKALRYELANHEYNITGDPTEALNVLGLSLEDVKQSPALAKVI